MGVAGSGGRLTWYRTTLPLFLKRVIVVSLMACGGGGGACTTVTGWPYPVTDPRTTTDQWIEGSIDRRIHPPIG